jgi:hypothetical protein
MVRFAVVLLRSRRSALRSHADLMLENLTLRQQLAAFAHSGRRPMIRATDRLLWIALRRLWSRWTEVLRFVKPETVIRWHRAGFRFYWTWLSRRRRRPGRPAIDRGIRDLIRRMVTENSTWGAPRIHGELLMLGFNVSERTVSRYLPRRAPAVIDASGTFSQHALMASMFRMSQAGVVIANATMVVSELLADWSSKYAEPIGKILGARVPNFGFVAAAFYHRPAK